jgi:hypothetical protein
VYDENQSGASEMSLPRDIETAARIACFEFETFIQGTALNPDGNEASEELVDTIGRAIMGERERCAKLAQSTVDIADDGISLFDAGEIIAAAIRGKPSPATHARFHADVDAAVAKAIRGKP